MEWENPGNVPKDAFEGHTDGPRVGLAWEWGWGFASWQLASVLLGC